MTTRCHDYDGKRLAPSNDELGDSSVPCRWWHPDFGRFCGRCGSGREDLHDGTWEFPSVLSGPFRPVPWNDRDRLRLGLPVEEQWWHQSAGWVVPA